MHYYAITDPQFYTASKDDFEKKVRDTLVNKRVDYFCFRDKISDNYEALAATFLKTLSEFPNTKALLHSNVALAHELGAYGVHLASTAFDEIGNAKRLGLYVVVSTHTLEEAIRAQTLGADAITFSPIFSTPNKGKPKGLEALNEIVDKITINIIALGGITTQEQIDAVAKSGAFGFASIRYFI